MNPVETIEKLEKRLNDLIKLTESIKLENEMLHKDQRILQQQLKAMQEKNSIAHNRIEQIVARLNSLKE